MSAISELFIEIPKITERTTFSWKLYKTQLKEGFCYIREEKELLTLSIMTFFINFGIVPFFFMGILLLCKGFLKGTDVHYGIIQSVMVAATFLGPILVSKLKNQMIMDKIIKALCIDALIITVIGLLSTGWFVNYVEFNVIGFAMFLLMIFAIVALVTFVNILIGTYFHTNVPNEKLGRVDAIMASVALGAIPLGQMTFGYLYEHQNIGLMIMLQSLMILMPLMVYTINDRKKRKRLVERTLTLDAK